MRQRLVLICLCGVFFLAVGPSPRYIEELRIGGGLGEPVDGGADFDKAGNISTDGSIVCSGLTVDGVVTAARGEFAQLSGVEILEAGEEDMVPGALHVYGGSGTQSGSIYLYTAESYDDFVDYWKWSSSVLGTLQLTGFGGSYNPGMILQFSAVGGLISFGYDTAIWSGGLDVGRAGLNSTQGRVTVYHHTSGTAPGYIKFYSCNGTASYVFASDDGAGLRISNSEPVSNSDGTLFAASKFRGADSLTDAVDLGTSEVAGLLPPNKIASGISDAQVNENLTIWSGSINNTPIGASVPSSARINRLTLMGVKSDSTRAIWSSINQTPSVASGNIYKIPNSWPAGQAITDLVDGAAGQRVLIIGGPNACVIESSGSFRLGGGTWTGVWPGTIEFIYDNGWWVEISRSNG